MFPSSNCPRSLMAVNFVSFFAMLIVASALVSAETNSTVTMDPSVMSSNASTSTEASNPQSTADAPSFTRNDHAIIFAALLGASSGGALVSLSFLFLSCRGMFRGAKKHQLDTVDDTGE
uniref:Transmembrane protein n=1 Tax=Steinernema glaseri TaxID=37863 RepID=A0A1I7YFW3_9BILA